MKVLIDGVCTLSALQPIVLKLEKGEKERLAKLKANHDVICFYPSDYDKDEIKELMSEI